MDEPRQSPQKLMELAGCTFSQPPRSALSTSIRDAARPARARPLLISRERRRRAVVDVFRRDFLTLMAREFEGERPLSLFEWDDSRGERGEGALRSKAMDWHVHGVARGWGFSWSASGSI